jgi:cobalt-zinc-cadmium efflux system protein
MHDHAHSHSHSRVKNIGIAVVLNVTFTLIEVIGGVWTNSLTILSDALHDFGDSVTLIVAWVLERKASAPADTKRTFGYQRLSLLSAILSALVLVAGSVVILTHAIPRLIRPEPVNASGMTWLAVLGIAFNGLGFLRLQKGPSISEKVLAWHLLEDVLGWTVILVGAVTMQFWDNPLIDPILTIGFIAFTLRGVGRNIKETFNIFLQGVPSHIDLESVRRSILSVRGVQGVHDIHVWSLEGETDIFTGHVVVAREELELVDDLRRRIREALREQHIEHSTIEIESTDECPGCEIEISQPG